MGTMWVFISVGGLLLLWLLPHMKTSRSDGTLLKKVHPYRTMMLYVMPTRAESVVYYDIDIKVDELLKYVKEARLHFHTDMTHCLVASIVSALKNTQELNRFSLGNRLYQRKGIWVTFSMKRKKLDKQSKLATVKKEFPEDMTFKELCSFLQDEIEVQRSDKETYHDKEYNLLTSLPRPFLSMGVRVIRWLDHHNLLPSSFITEDALYTSAFVANLGSIGLNSVFHHLYEWGNCPLFIMAGKIEEKAIIIDGKVVVQKVLPLRITYDERIGDGLTASGGLQMVKETLENPFTHFGCLKEDGSDTISLGEQHRNEKTQ